MSAGRPLAGGLRRRFGVLAIAALAICAAAAPAHASEAPPARIIGGSPVGVDAFSWQVGVAFNDAYWAGTEAQRFACGGTLVAPTVVITAAHCVYDRPVVGAGFNAADQFEVFAGRTTLSSGAGQVIDVGEILYLAKGAGGAPVLESRSGPDLGPELFDTKDYDWDIAVLFLRGPVTVAAPVLIAGADEASTWSARRRGVTSGWGAVNQTGPFEVSDQLVAVSVPIVADRKCRRLLSSNFNRRSDVCAATLPGGGHGHCFGDSGGPLVVPVEVGAEAAWRLAGVVSAGGTESECAPPGQPDLYERVAGKPTRSAIAALTPLIGASVVGSGARPLEPPRTKIKRHPPRKSRRATAKFRFAAGEPATFACKVDNNPWEPCGATFRKRFAGGRHRIKVRATDSLGQADPSAARFRWRVRRH